MSVVDSDLEAVLEACTAANHTGKILRQFKLSILGVLERPIQIKGFDSKGGGLPHREAVYVSSVLFPERRQGGWCLL